MNRLVLCFMVVVSLGFATGPAAGQSKCEGDKLLASGQRADAGLHCQSKDAKDGVPIDPACQAKAEKKFLAAWVKAEARGDCSDPGDLALRDEIIERYLEVFPNRLRQFEDANACVAAKLRAAADAASDKFACVGRGMTKGAGLDLACLDKADGKLLTVFGKAEAKLSCLTFGDGDDINHLVTEFVDCSLGPNKGSCGSILTPVAIDVAPGSVFGYLPLDAFAIAPMPIGDEQILNFNVATFVYNNVRHSRIGISSNGDIVVGGGEADDNAFVPQTLPDPGRATTCWRHSGPTSMAPRRRGSSWPIWRRLTVPRIGPSSSGA